MGSTVKQETWQDLAEALTAGQPPLGLECTSPPTSQWCSVLDALNKPVLAASSRQWQAAQEIHAQLDDLLRRLNAFHEMSRCPVIAITGLLNSGKSSLLATYLSPASRERVLRGLDNASGTHRFVLWLPSKWQHDNERLTCLFAYLAELFGSQPELLSEDPSEAALQYSGVVRRPIAPATSTGTPPREVQADSDSKSPPVEESKDVFETPLVAYDSALDDLQIGLIDCPDIQSGYVLNSTHNIGEHLASHRQKHLAAIGRLCSAFIVVCKLNSLHDDGLQRVLMTLRDTMPGVPRWLAINKVKSRYAPEVVALQARSLADRFGLQEIYVAYDFRSALAASRIPAYPMDLVREHADEQHPIFFEALADSAQPRHPKYLRNIGEQLDVGELARESSRSLVLQFKVQATRSMDWLDTNTRCQSQQIASAWKAIADACFDFMAQRAADGRVASLRLQASPAIVGQLTESLQRTAPVWMRLSLKIDRTARQLQQAVSNSAARFKILGKASQSVAKVAQRFKRGDGAQVVTPERLATAIRSADLDEALLGVPRERLVTQCEEAMQRFSDEDATQLDAQQLDAWSREVWRNMSIKEKLWKGTQPLALVMAPFLAVILIPIDAGGTAVLVFASTKELLAAAGIAAILGPTGSGRETLGIVQRETPWRQLSDLFAICCDQLGLPRPDAGALPLLDYCGSPRRLVASQTESKPRQLEPAVEVWKPSEALESRVAAALQRINP